jgi:diguanylate cyclase (GGDEF)-like protein
MKSSILIVDDSVTLHTLLRACLQGEPIDIHSAYNGEDAIKMAAQLKPSLTLLDVDMPTLNGYEVCRRMKADLATRNLPIIFLTAFASAEENARGLDLGANDYITKPFKPEELCARVRAALRTYSHLDHLTMVDGVTKLWNQTYLDHHLRSKLSLARRANQPLACVMGDIDSLSKINSLYTENVGDDVLRCVANIICRHRREQDMICYLGSGKYIALLPGTNCSGATQFANRARAAIETELKSYQQMRLSVTCSFGIAQTEAGDDSPLLDRAGLALRFAKRSGGNCVSLNEPSRAPTTTIV